mgnify:FL=1|jgi:hypothetical protein
MPPKTATQRVYLSRDAEEKRLLESADLAVLADLTDPPSGTATAFPPAFAKASGSCISTNLRQETNRKLMSVDDVAD